MTIQTETAPAGHGPAHELRPGVDPAGLAYHVESLGVCAVMQAPVAGAAPTYAHARRQLIEHLRAVATTLPELT